ncbi:hypothetical protein E4T42_09653 [Aureobasidium subglaciale]|nr:hypothetical protein E4T42_09653 [Aureobasidium subglaciale]
MDIRGSLVGISVRYMTGDRYLRRSPSHERAAFEEALHNNPDCTGDDGETTICHWYSDDDAANPQNWSTFAKTYVVATMSIYACTIYMAASLFTPDSEAFMEEFGTGNAYTSLGIGIYPPTAIRGLPVADDRPDSLGYGCGPLLFGPLSEIPAVGRNWPYLVSYILFILVSIPTALAQNASVFMFLRFLQGFFGSPALTTGGASLADTFEQVSLPYAMTVWVAGTFCAPAVGQLFSETFCTPYTRPYRVWIRGPCSRLAVLHVGDFALLYARTGYATVPPGNKWSLYTSPACFDPPSNF